MCKISPQLGSSRCNLPLLLLTICCSSNNFHCYKEPMRTYYTHIHHFNSLSRSAWVSWLPPWFSSSSCSESMHLLETDQNFWPLYNHPTKLPQTTNHLSNILSTANTVQLSANMPRTSKLWRLLKCNLHKPTNQISTENRYIHDTYQTKQTCAWGMETSVLI